MTATASSLIAPAAQAFPKYAPVLDALASLMNSDGAVATTPVAPAPVPTPPVTLNPGTISATAGRPVALAGDGTACAFDFGDPSAPFNALRGYNAAHVYDSPGTYIAKVTSAGKASVATTITVAADARPIVTLGATDDLAAAIAKVKTPTVLLLPAGATFDLKAPASISTNGVTLRGAPGITPRIRRIAAAGVYSTLVIGGADISIEGIEFDSDQPLKPSGNVKVGIYALNILGQRLSVRNCTFRNLDDAFHCEPQARGLVGVNCKFTNELRACAAYLDAMQDVVLLGFSAVGSVCEHIVRLEGAQNVLVAGCDVDNKDGKETVAIRMGTNVSIDGNTLRAWARISEGVSAAPAVYCKNILFAANHFAGLRPDGPWMQINPGSESVVFDGNTFDMDATQVAIAIQAPVTDVSLTNNKLARVNSAATTRPLVDPFGNPTYTETGTSA